VCLIKVFCMCMCAFSEINRLFRDLSLSSIWTFSSQSSWFNLILWFVVRLYINIPFDMIAVFHNSSTQFPIDLSHIDASIFACYFIYFIFLFWFFGRLSFWILINLLNLLLYKMLLYKVLIILFYIKNFSAVVFV